MNMNRKVADPLLAAALAAAGILALACAHGGLRGVLFSGGAAVPVLVLLCLLLLAVSGLAWLALRRGGEDRRELALCRDAVERLQETSRTFEKIFSSISSIIVCLNGEDRVVRWNTGAEAAFGRDEGWCLGRRFAECGLDWDWERFREAARACRGSLAPVRVEDMGWTAPDGRRGVLGVTLSPVQSAGLPGLIVLASDVTALKVQEARRTQEQKMLSIGRLAAGIAHEINTPTQYVGDNIRFLGDAFGDLLGLLDRHAALLAAGLPESGEARREMLRELEEATREADLDYLRAEIPLAISQSLEGVARVSKIVLSMKQFSHPGGRERTAADVNKVLDDTATICRNEWKYVADLVLDLDQGLPLVPCYLSELNQVFLNVILNASQAIAGAQDPSGRAGARGRITVSTRRDGGWAVVRIADTGPGVPEAIRDRIFDPFFTTKDVGKGTGQGLAIAHTVVSRHGGSIDVDSAPGGGAVFTIRLPLDAGEADHDGTEGQAA